MIEVCFLFLTDTESLCELRFQVRSGLVRHGGLDPGETGNLEVQPASQSSHHIICVVFTYFLPVLYFCMH